MTSTQPHTHTPADSSRSHTSSSHALAWNSNRANDVAWNWFEFLLSRKFLCVAPLSTRYMCSIYRTKCGQVSRRHGTSFYRRTKCINHTGTHTHTHWFTVALISIIKLHCSPNSLKKKSWNRTLMRKKRECSTSRSEVLRIDRFWEGKQYIRFHLKCG